MKSLANAEMRREVIPADEKPGVLTTKEEKHVIDALQSATAIGARALVLVKDAVQVQLVRVYQCVCGVCVCMCARVCVRVCVHVWHCHTCICIPKLLLFMGKYVLHFSSRVCFSAAVPAWHTKSL